MADPVTKMRKNTLWSIDQNPVAITIKRTEKMETEGYFTETISQIGPLTVRIFPVGNGSNKVNTDLIGTKGIDTGWGLLADWQADLRAGPNVRDEVEVAGLGLFVVKAVQPQKIQGQVVGYQVDLERVS